MDARIKHFFSKARGKDKGNGNYGPANEPPHLDPRGDLVQSNAEERINQSPPASEENKAELKDEYGIKVLYGPDQPRADIVFLHGLTGGQLSTWTAPGATAPWPSILLPDDIPDARISAFGYDADVVNLLGPAGQNRIRHHARNLLRGIADMWLDAEVDGLPILFVVHSLGGLICENALTVANNAEQHERRVLECTKAIAFLGTPHRGSDLASWATIAGNMVKVVKRANTNILDVLKPSSEVLENLTQDFHTMLRSREQAQNPSINIACFVEELPVSRAGKTFMVVPSRSATLERYPYGTIHADHIGMTKFKEKNNDYKSVALQLKRWLKELALRETTPDGIIGPAKSDPKTGNLIGVNIPRKSVSYFVTRIDILDELNKCLSSKPKPKNIVLLGMGGSGKTQLALDCCRRAEVDSSFTAVIWIDASSPATIAQSYGTIAQKVTGGSQSITEVEESMAIVEGALQQQKGKWLAVLDNFDNPMDFREHSIQYYVPKATNGSLLFTSRHTSSERLGHVIRVDGMSEDESLDLLLQRSVSESIERAQGLAIAAMLGYLALALDQAGAYIRARSLPLQDFGLHYRRRKKKILEEVPEQWEYRRKLGETDRETVLSVFVTWELSFEHIRGSKEARDRKEHFLTLAAHFDNNCISQRYFEAYCRSERAGWMQTFITGGEWDEYEYGDLAAECRKLSLLQTLDRQADGVQFSLHPVVRDWLKVRKEREEQKLYGREFASLLICYIKGVRFDELNLQVKQETLLHIDACVQNDGETVGDLRGSALTNWSYFTSVFAFCYQSNGQYNEAEELLKRVLAGREKKLGSNHPNTLETMHNLSNIYAEKGQYNEAEKLCKRVLTVREEKLGPDYPDTLRTVHNLANIFFEQGQYDEAEKLYKRVLTVNEEKLGPDHPDTLRTVHNLANIFFEQGQYDEAEKLYKRVLTVNEEKLGPGHPYTLGTVQNLANTFSRRGQYNEAEKLYKRVLTDNEEKLGPDHPDTLGTVHNLADLFYEKGQYNEAEKLYKRALAGREEKLGRDHPYTLRTVRDFTIFLRDQGRVDEADFLTARFDPKR